MKVYGEQETPKVKDGAILRYMMSRIYDEPAQGGGVFKLYMYM